MRIALHVSFVLPPKVREHTLLPLLEGITTVLKLAQTEIEHSGGVDKGMTARLHTVVTSVSIEALSAIITEVRSPRGRHEDAAPKAGGRWSRTWSIPCKPHRSTLEASRCNPS